VDEYIFIEMFGSRLFGRAVKQLIRFHGMICSQISTQKFVSNFV